MADENKKVTVDEVNKYAASYSQDGLFDKISKYAKNIGLNLINEALKLWYVTDNPNLPGKTKATIIGALGYLISPLDLVPDVLPVVGYTDDAGAVALAIAMAQAFIDQKVKDKAKAKIDEIFGAGSSKDL
ncbi:MAG: DUF1232 domain-containing protein [Phascolarctobacterium sp.]|nr:DUF1232 domain-containing protein [Methanobrevibacter sp.]MBR2139711.1 DUF1232 domain-containing protein [Phascolarctobacterium sp.]MBR6636823.1 DUF1232 domain-containing protein [Phascolarctobacterium sp.]